MQDGRAQPMRLLSYYPPHLENENANSVVLSANSVGISGRPPLLSTTLQYTPVPKYSPPRRQSDEEKVVFFTQTQLTAVDYGPADSQRRLLQSVLQRRRPAHNSLIASIQVQLPAARACNSLAMTASKQLEHTRAGCRPPVRFPGLQNTIVRADIDRKSPIYMESQFQDQLTMSVSPARGPRRWF